VSWFKNACFLSYRHGQRSLKQRFIREFHDALSSELELLRDEEVYVDWERLEGGDFYNEALARALYESACLVAVYQANYFDLKHSFCAREYRAMCELETERLDLLPRPEDRNHSLIIPVILRGENSVPSEITSRRQYHDFSKFMLVDEELARHPLYAPKIREISQYIHERCCLLENAAIREDGGDTFRLPDQDAIKPWLERITPPQAPFPGVAEV
jgi:hypothetical protein